MLTASDRETLLKTAQTAELLKQDVLCLSRTENRATRSFSDRP